MTDLPARHLHTGGDPRTLPDYSALRDELSKLAHPARPDINWQYVEKCCLSLFETNGIELQTAAWYTLARTHRSGVNGMHEGLAILETLTRHQWGVLWPHPVRTRVQILSDLSKRLQQILRTFTLTSTDLNAIYQTEQCLQRLSETLQRYEILHLVQTKALCTQLHNTALRLEKDHSCQGDLVSELDKTRSQINIEPAHRGEKWIYVAQSANDITPSPSSIRQRWPAFFAGIFAAMIAFSILAGSYLLWWEQPRENILSQLAPSLPEGLTEQQLRQFSLSASRLNNQRSDYFRLTTQHLTQLASLSPGWSAEYGNQLIQQSRLLYPGAPETEILVRHWQQELEKNALPTEGLDSWHQGMIRLRQLADRLDNLDRKRGQYLTVSELKTQVFAITKAFNQTPPTEERVRQLTVAPADKLISPARLSQTDLHMKQLFNRYSLIRQQTDSAATSP